MDNKSLLIRRRDSRCELGARKTAATVGYVPGQELNLRPKSVVEFIQENAHLSLASVLLRFLLLQSLADILFSLGMR